MKDFFVRRTTDRSTKETRANQLQQRIQTKAPTKVEHLTSHMKEKGITVHSGTNRDVYIVHPEGRGYKIQKPESHWSGGVCDANPDLRLNTIYQSTDFYGGKYSHLATHTTVQLDKVDVPTFDLIPGAEPLGKREKIPQHVLEMLSNAGFIAYDVKPDNFVKIKNEDGGYDYLPIDAKLIGRERSNSYRTLSIKDMIQSSGSQDAYNGRHIDRS